VETATAKSTGVEDEILGLISRFGRLYERDIVQMKLEDEGEIGEAITAVENEAARMGPWPTVPIA